MACGSCKQNKCICEGATGPERLYIEATGSTGCPTSPPAVDEGSVCDPQVCCNYFHGREGANGPSFLMSAGGRIQMSAATECDPYECPPQEDPDALFGTLFDGFVGAGSLVDPVCADLPPGSYRAEARLILYQAIPGSRVVVLYRPNCDDSSVEYAVIDCQAPCAPIDCTDGPLPVGPTPLQPISCNGFLYVPNPNCNPGFRLLTTTGCVPDGSALADVAPYIENFQFLLERVSDRDVVECSSILEEATLTPAASILCPV